MCDQESVIGFHIITTLSNFLVPRQCSNHDAATAIQRRRKAAYHGDGGSSAAGLEPPCRRTLDRICSEGTSNQEDNKSKTGLEEKARPSSVARRFFWDPDSPRGS